MPYRFVFSLNNFPQTADSRHYPAQEPIPLEDLEAYNRIAREVLAGTGVMVWDSSLPVSPSYTQYHQCTEDTSNSTITGSTAAWWWWWKCFDTDHTQAVVAEQNVDMLLSDACNMYMGMGTDYCE